MLMPPIPAEKAAEVADVLDSATIALLVLACLALVAFVIWLGRELLASRLSVRMLSENQRLARREQQHAAQLHKERSRSFLSKSGQRVKADPTPAPVVPLPPVPPPLPKQQPEAPVSLGIEGVDNVGKPPDFSDSRVLTELDLRPDPDPEDEPLLNLLNETTPIELAPARARTAVWPHRKLPPIDKD